MRKSLQIIAFFALGFNVASAQTTIQVPAAGPTAISLGAVNVAYTQDFKKVTGTDVDTEGLQSGGSDHTNLPVGWAFSKTSNNATAPEGNYGTSAGGSTNATGRGIFSFGNTNANVDRALGIITGGGVANTHSGKIGVKFVNNTSVVITSLSISFTGEQWRRLITTTAGSSAAASNPQDYPKSKLSFSYRIGDGTLNEGTWTSRNELDFEGPMVNPRDPDDSNLPKPAMDGNASANREEKTLTITGLNIPNGGLFWLRWEKNSAVDGTTNNDGLAIDDFSIIPNPSTQPVNLKSFNFQKTGSSIKLNWQTVSELNNDRFELSRSNDGSKFYLLTSISGKGTSNEINNYSHTDFNPLAGTSYYQLKQIDKNGDATTYPLLVVKTTEAELSLDVKKTAGNLASLKIYTPATGSGVLKMYDIAGKQVLSKQLNLTKGYNELSVDLPTANGSIYVFKLAANGTVTTKKLALL